MGTFVFLQQRYGISDYIINPERLPIHAYIEIAKNPKFGSR